MRMLTFSRTTGFRHDSIPTGIEALRNLGRHNDFEVVATEDPAAFSSGELAGFTVIAFLSTSGTVLDDDGRDGFMRFVADGGGFVGIHAASTTEYDWPWFGDLVGARFDSHPEVQPGRIVVEDRGHPSTEHLPAVWERTDEWYDFRTNPRPTVRVLLRADETSYTGGKMGTDHPLAWHHRNCGGPSFYTALGHTDASYGEPAMLAHLLGGIRYATSR